ncbi:MAG: type IX secretion system membrane protein PorP/SprF [Cytophagaceae bacterium]
MKNGITAYRPQNGRKVSALVFLLCLSFHLSLAQTEPMYSQYMFNTLPLNPAYAGSQEDFTATSVYRKQWVNMDGAPSTQTLSAHSPIKNKNIALGFTAFNDRIGVTGRMGFSGVYAYRINFKNKSKLSLGLQAGMIRMSTGFTQLNTKLPNDPTLSMDRVSYTLPGVGTGIYWYSQRFFLGASAPDLLGLQVNKFSGQFVRHRHYFVHGGYAFKLTDQICYMPGFLVKGVPGNPLQVDLNNIFIFNEVLWLGVSYRSLSSLNFLVMAQLTDQISLGYSYDAPVSSYTYIAGASHELKLSYRFVYFKDNAYMPRYF